MTHDWWRSAPVPSEGRDDHQYLTQAAIANINSAGYALLERLRRRLLLPRRDVSSVEPGVRGGPLYLEGTA